MAKILITGGTGMLGTHLSKLLADSGHEIRHLSRNPSKDATYPTYQWDIRKEEIDPEALQGVDHIIHLAGAGIADGRWTDERKKVIISSRVNSAGLLRKQVEEHNVTLKSFISASAIGYYGADTGPFLQTESSDPGNDFLAEVVTKWESAADEFQTITKVAKIRIGVVLSPEGGAMKEIMKPIKMMVGAPLGSGDQMTSWIHIHDLCLIFKHVLDKNITGIYNATAPNPVSNERLTKVIAKQLNKPLWLPNVPSFVLKIVFGEMSAVVLGGNIVSSQAIQDSGFEFKYEEIEEAVADLLPE